MNDVTLILLPGMDGTGNLFAPLISELPGGARYSLVRYPSDQKLGYESLLPLVREAFPTTGQFVLVAESFSGPLAIMAAAEKPRGLQAVILCASFARNPFPIPAKFVLPFACEMLFRIKAVVVQSWFLLGKCGSREIHQMLSDAVAANLPSVLAYRAQAVLRVDVREELRSCAVPLLYIRGQCDRIISRRNLSDVLSACPNASETLVAPHLVLQTKPAAALAVIVEFLDREMALSTSQNISR